MENRMQKNTDVNDILPEIVVRGIDYSLLTQREWQLLKIYNDLRSELKKDYPIKITDKEAGNPNYAELYDDEELEDGYDIDTEKARNDYRATSFRKAMTTAAEMMDKIDLIKKFCTSYEIYCVRLYCKYLLNYMVTPKSKKRKEGLKQFLSVFKDADIYEIVESYFKICRKHGLTTYEEPYYWLSPNRKREIKYEGEMLKRSTMFDDNEIRVSILEELC